MVAHWLAELDGRRIAVEVPASSANLGAGYDCLGVALECVNHVELEVRGWSRGSIELTVDGEGQGELPEDRSNRFVQGLEAGLREIRGELPDGVGWRIEMRNAIPLSRGLGSSAAATVAGIVAAGALLGGELDRATQLRLADRIEAKASACRPLRYCARASSTHRRSRKGCCPVNTVPSVATPAC